MTLLLAIFLCAVCGLLVFACWERDRQLTIVLKDLELMEESRDHWRDKAEDRMNTIYHLREQLRSR